MAIRIICLSLSVWLLIGLAAPVFAQEPTAQPTPETTPTAQSTPETTSTELPAATPTGAPSPPAPTPPAPPPVVFEVRLNEFLAAPSVGQEYVELFNLGPDSADISGWQIDDVAGGGGAPKIIPANTIIPPGGFWVLTFASFLNNSSDDVRLLDAGGVVVDSYSYSSFTVDVSTSRWPDGSGAWVDGTPQTPNAPNLPPAAPTPTVVPTSGPTPPPTPAITPTATPAPAPVAIRLNEYLAAPLAGGSEFVEVVNLGTEAVNLSGWRIRDASGNTRSLTLTNLLPGQYHAQQFASGLLNNTGDSIELLDSGGAVLDATSYAGSTSARSTSRLPDGTGAWVDGTTPTPNAANQPLPPPAVFVVRLNEFLAAPISGTEFIELYNLGPDPANLGGWQIDDVADGGGAPKTIPANTIIPPGGFWTLSAGSFLNNSGDSVRLIDLGGGLTDVYTYTSSVAGLSTSRLPDGSGAWVDGTPLTPAAPNQPPPPPPPATSFRVTINEFLAAPISGTEFIELYNLGPDPANLGGWQIDDAADGGAPKTIPANTVIPPGGFWALSTSSFLNNSGDSVRLIDPSGVITDSYSYSASSEGLSTSRLPDGLGAWVDATPPTPNAPNLPPPAPPVFRLVINEFLAAPFSGGAEFIELYNRGPDPASLTGWKIDDVADGGASPHTIPADTTIAPGGFWVLDVGSFLNNSGDSLNLIDPSGLITDTYTYTSSFAGMSTSRLPDGLGAWTDGTPPTPDAPNRGPDALPTGIFINEVYPHPPVGQREWIELYSTYTDTVDLSGWLLDDVAGGSAPTVLPAGATIAPGQWRQFLLKSNILNDGGDQARLLAPDGTLIDTMSYGRIKKPTSWSRLPDGFGPWYSNTPPSPNAPNQPPPEPPAAPEIAPGSADAPGSVLITEVVYDVPGDRDESANEWLEITNVTSATVLIEGWSIQDNKATTGIPSFSIDPAEVVVLAPSAELLQHFPAFSATLILVGKGKLGNGLGNNGDQLQLIDGAGTPIDGLSWGEITTVFDPAAPDVKTGHSLQRQPATADADSAADWVDSPTPTPGSLDPGEIAAPAAPPEVEEGPPTTAAPGEVLITQVLYDPRSPIQEPGGEWIEIINNRPLTQTLRGWSIGDTRAADRLPTITLGPDEIVLVAASKSISTTYTLTGQYVVLRDGSIGAGLNNGGDTLTLRDGAGTLIDALSWGDNASVLDPAAPNVPEGSSLVREPPDSDSDSAADWTAQENAQPSGSTLIDRPVWSLPAASTVILSEVLAAPKLIDSNGDGTVDRGDEWIELVNLSAEPVDLSGWSIDDLADGGSKPHVLAADTQIEGNGYLVLSGALTKLSLNNSGLEQVRLLRPDGTLADLLEYRSTRPDRSWSRVPSPAGDWAASTDPTPNA
ncbi:MAG: lamin tail domain-containing protein, partial [Herpetosiphonaceae bacterium]|nr:lamin tail domain-containing protein [Herpetosiphonaceae bacterium]